MSHPQKCILLLLLGLLGSTSVIAQKTIEGTVSDSESGEILPSANIFVKDTYRGTITNRNGHYALNIPDSLLPATVVVRYIGYKSVERTIKQTSASRQHFELHSQVTELEEIVVTDEDPALVIMREVINRKQKWREKLESYAADAYTRQTLANDTSIVSITETTSQAFWDREKGHREVIKSKKQTANLDASDNFAGVNYLPNFYDDNIEIAGFNLVGVTHPDALDYYHFKLVDRTILDEQRVYEIEVTPKRKLQPLLKGTIYVLDEAYALLEVELTPNEVVSFPPPVKSFTTYYEQQFNNFGREFWLPVDVRINGDVKISMVGLELPTIKFRQLSRLTNYQVNITLPDSLYRENTRMTVDSVTVDSDSLFVRSVDTVPLSTEEERAYNELDSTATLEKAFRPTGFLARFVDDEDDPDEQSSRFKLMDNIPGKLRPKPRFNRVDELYAGLKYELPLFKNKLHTSVEGGYSTGYDKWGFGLGAYYTLLLGDTFRQRVGFDLRHETQPRYHSAVYEPTFTMISNLFGARDYYDYYRNEGVQVYSRVTHTPSDLSLKLQYRNEQHRSLTAHSAYDLLGKNNTAVINPPIDEGHLSTAEVELGYNIQEGFTYGATGRKFVKVGVEYSDGLLGSDYNFTKYTASLDWTFETFYQRRFLANTLDIKMEAGTSTGRLPLQKYGIVDGVLGYFSPFGALKTIRKRPYEGDKYFSLSMEHNFRSIPFELVGLRFLAEKNYGLILFGGLGRTWFPESRRNRLQANGFEPRVPEKLHLEAGISLNGVLGLFRIDFARRLDEPAFLVNVSVARIL